MQSTVLELGGGRCLREQFAHRAVRPLSKLRARLSVVDGAGTALEHRVSFDELGGTTPHTGEMLLSELPISALGTPIALEALETLEARLPKSLVVLTRDTISPISVGDYAFMFGRDPTQT